MENKKNRLEWLKKHMKRQPANRPLDESISEYAACSFESIVNCYELLKELDYDEEMCNNNIKRIKEFYGETEND